MWDVRLGGETPALIYNRNGQDHRDNGLGVARPGDADSSRPRVTSNRMRRTLAAVSPAAGRSPSSRSTAPSLADVIDPQSASRRYAIEAEMGPHRRKGELKQWPYAKAVMRRTRRGTRAPVAARAFARPTRSKAQELVAAERRRSRRESHGRTRSRSLRPVLSRRHRQEFRARAANKARSSRRTTSRTGA